MHKATDNATSSTGMTLTPEQIQDMIQSSVQTSVNAPIASTFSARGISGQSFYTALSSMHMSSLSPSWFIDS